MHRAEKISSRICHDREVEKQFEKHRQKLERIKPSLHTNPPKKQPYFQLHLRLGHRVLKPSNTSSHSTQPTEQKKGPGGSNVCDTTNSRTGTVEEEAYADEAFEEDHEPQKSTEARSTEQVSSQLQETAQVTGWRQNLTNLKANYIAAESQTPPSATSSAENTKPKRSYFSIKSKSKRKAPVAGAAVHVQAHRKLSPSMRTMPGYENMTNISSGMSVYLPTVAHPIKVITTSPTKEKVNLTPGFRSLRKAMPQVPSLPPLQADESLSVVFQRTIQSATNNMVNGPVSALDSPNSFNKADAGFNTTAARQARGIPLYKTGSFVGGTYLVLSVYHGHAIQNAYGFDVVVWHPEKKRKYELEISKEMTNELLEAVSSCSTAAQSRAASGTNLAVEQIAKRICEHVNYTRIGREGQGLENEEEKENQSQGEMVFMVSSALANSLHKEEVLISIAPTSMAFIAHQSIELWSVKSQSKKPYHLTMTTKNTLLEEHLSIHFRAQELPIKQEGEGDASDVLEVTMHYQDLREYLQKKFDVRVQVLSPEVIVLESTKYLRVNDSALELMQFDDVLKATVQSTLSQDLVLYSGMIWKQMYLLTRVQSVDSSMLLPPPECMSQVKDEGFIFSVLNPHTNLWMQRTLTKQQMERALQTLVAAQHHQDMIEALHETKWFCSQVLRHVTFEIDLKRQEVLCFPLLLGAEDEKAIRNGHGTTGAVFKAQQPSPNSPKTSDNVTTNTDVDHHHNHQVTRHFCDRYKEKAVVRIQARWRGTTVRFNMWKEIQQDQEEAQEVPVVVERHHHHSHHSHTHQPVVKKQSIVSEYIEWKSKKTKRSTARPKISEQKPTRPLTPCQGTRKMAAARFNSEDAAAKSIQTSYRSFCASRSKQLFATSPQASFTSSVFINREDSLKNEDNLIDKENEEDSKEEETEEDEDSTDSSTVVTVSSSSLGMDLGGGGSARRSSVSFQIVFDQVQELKSIYESDDHSAMLIHSYSMSQQLTSINMKQKNGNGDYMITLKLKDGEEIMLEDVKSQLREHLGEAGSIFLSEELLHVAAKSIQKRFRKHLKQQQAAKKKKQEMKENHVNTTEQQVEEVVFQDHNTRIQARFRRVSNVKRRRSNASEAVNEVLMVTVTAETVEKVEPNGTSSSVVSPSRQGKKIDGHFCLVKKNGDINTSNQVIGPGGQLL